VNQHLPAPLLQSLHDVPGYNEKAFIDAHELQSQVVSVRVHPQKHSQASEPLFAGMEPVPWCSTGFYLPERPFFTFDPLLHAGAYYVQEASSMFLEQCITQLADLSSPLKVLDLCAAPGGKSTLLLSLVNDNSLLVSNEVIKTRVGALVENISKWGLPNVIVTNNDPKDFARLPGYFDVMVVDAPCSGSGLFRKDPMAIDHWSEEAVAMCSLRQKRILADAFGSLRKNGLLVYSTCSYSVAENEDVCDWLVEEYNVRPLSLQLDSAWNITTTTSEKHRATAYRFFPDKTRGEGFFVACFQKTYGSDETTLRPKRSGLQTAPAREQALVRPWLQVPDHLQLFDLGKEIFGFPHILVEDLAMIHANVYVKKAGVLVGKIVRDEVLPAHELAVSTIVKENLPSVSLKKEEALQYLRKEEVTLSSAHRGWMLVTYKGINLGWIKAMANRANNYYPKEWRILKSGIN